MLAVDLVRRGAARFAGRTAVHFEDRSLTYAEVDGAANRLAHVLAGLGVGRGDRVGLLLGNGLWSISVDFACLKAGAARVPLNGRLSAAEHTRMLQDTGATLLVYGPERAERAIELGSSVPGLKLACLGGPGPAGHLDLSAAMREASPADPMLPAAPDDVILILSCFAVLSDHVPAAAQAVRTAWISSGLAWWGC
ncbi:AMP-binding protein, partial [Streptomyces sp. NPDC059460]|uniref:AMP-binding protein n=1 Tax=Streptomyces sp. NPDC059460 TaxID=3346840 RepID=UPI0036BA598D